MIIEKQFAEIRTLIQKAKNNAFHAVNVHLIDLYWEIGKYISEKIKNSEWGEGIVNNLSDYLKRTEPEMKGFSTQNLWRMKQFYEIYFQNEKLSALLRELNWTNNLIIISKTTTEKEREFYINLAIKEKLSSRELERQINSALFERVLLSQEKLSPVMREIHPEAHLIFKDNYVFDFLALPKKYSEEDLRKAIIENLKDFILEFGRDFSFVGEEYRLQVGQKDYFVDLLFFNRELQCLVAIDLKINDFKPEYLGKLEFYLEALDRDIRKDHEKPSVGIILCKNKDSKVVEYALSRSVSPALVSKYETSLFDKKLLERKLDEFYSLAEPAANYIIENDKVKNK
jgi:predicted nuclease of restriction endonuclease-like (RecB) superfamily